MGPVILMVKGKVNETVKTRVLHQMGRMLGPERKEASFLTLAMGEKERNYSLRSRSRVCWAEGGKEGETHIKEGGRRQFQRKFSISPATQRR